MSILARFRPLLLVLLSALGLLAVIGISYFVLSGVPSKNLPSQTPTSTNLPPQISIVPVPAGWLVYTDPNAGVTFSYPPDAYLETGTSDQHPLNFIRLVFKQAEQSSLILDIRDNKAKSTPNELAAQAFEEASNQAAPKSLMDAEEKLAVGGLYASKYVIPPTLTDFMLFIPDGDKMLVIYPGSNDAPASGKTPQLDLFNQVLGTFNISAK